MYKQLVIFTDLDGTLLDHHSYSYAAALPMLEKLQEHHISVIPNTSKTFAEVQQLRNELSLQTPFVVENGAAIYIPDGFFDQQPADCEFKNGYWRKAFSRERSYWLELITANSKDLDGVFKGFSEMSNDELSLATGLSTADAAQANDRQFSEPLHWLGTEQQKTLFSNRMKSAGANVLQGGRFLHISGQSNKGIALRWLTQEFARQNSNTQFKSVALGDSFNDNDMLESADIAVQIKTSKHDFPKLFRTDAVWQSTKLGPKGWAECLDQILTQELQI